MLRREGVVDSSDALRHARSARSGDRAHRGARGFGSRRKPAPDANRALAHLGHR